MGKLLALVSGSSIPSAPSHDDSIEIGNKSEMIFLEKDFVNGLFTPFTDDESG